MGLAIDDQNKPISTPPKLSLSKFPCKKLRQLHQIQMLTPPHHPLASIPFQWEEAPGKPRPTIEPNKKPNNNMCLDPPPRLMLNDDHAKMTIMPSPTTVLDGPYVGRSLSLACTFSFRKGPIMGREDGLRPKKKVSERKFGSGRWESFKELEGVFDSRGRGNSDLSTTLGDFFKSEKIVKNTRGRRKSGGFVSNVSCMNSNLWVDIYASFKHAIPWRRSVR